LAGEPELIYDAGPATIAAVGAVGGDVVIVKQWPPEFLRVVDGRTETVTRFDSVFPPGAVVSLASAAVGPLGVYWALSSIGTEETILGFTRTNAETTVLGRRPPTATPYLRGTRRGVAFIEDVGRIAWVDGTDTRLQPLADVGSLVLDVAVDDDALYIATGRGIAAKRAGTDLTWLTTDIATSLVVDGDHLYWSRRGNSIGSDPERATYDGSVSRMHKTGGCRSRLLGGVKSGDLAALRGELFVVVLPFLDFGGPPGELWRVQPSACRVACE
jgi:hypothetical protein